MGATTRAARRPMPEVGELDAASMVGLSTLQDVRQGLLSDEQDEQLQALHRTWERAYRRVERLREAGWDAVELEGRLLAARALELREEPRPALLLVEETLVLAKAMAELGDPPPEEQARPAGQGVGGVSHEEVERLIEQEHERARVAWTREDEALRILLEEELETLRVNDLAAIRYEGRRERERHLEAAETWLEAKLETGEADLREARARLERAAAERAELQQALARSGVRYDAQGARLDELVQAQRRLEKAIEGAAQHASAELQGAREGLERALQSEREAREGSLDELRQELLARLAAVGERLREERVKALETRLAAFLHEERFQIAAADAAAARPQKLLDRPETLARIDAVASRLDELVVERASFRERIVEAARAAAAGVAAEQPPAEPLEVEDLGPRLDELEARLGQELTRVREQLAAGPRPEEVARLARAELERLLADERQLTRQSVEGALSGEPFAQRVRKLADEVARRGDEAQAESFSQRLQEELGKLLRSRPLAERVRGLLEEGLSTSQALRRALVEQIDDDEGAGMVVDQRIDERVNERSSELLDQRTLARKVTAAVRAEMVEEVFEKNVDQRVKRLADQGFLEQRIKALIQEQVQPAVDAAIARSETMQRLVQKEMANREAIKTAALTGDGLSDPATAVVRSEAFQELISAKLAELVGGRRRGGPPAGGDEEPDKPRGGSRAPTKLSPEESRARQTGKKQRPGTGSSAPKSKKPKGRKRPG